MMIRQPAVAGQFYPGEASALRDAVEGYLGGSGVQAAPERVRVLIGPHAGYLYSGPTAGHLFARARGKKPRRVVLLGRSHRHYFEGASIWASGAFETPLGRLPIDETWAEQLGGGAAASAPDVHRHEHCLEVMLPFLQVALGEIPIVPVLFGEDPQPWHLRFGERLAALMDPADLLVASTDLSHYLPEAQANPIDKVSLDVILSRDTERLVRGLKDETCSMCGGTAVAAAMCFGNAIGADDWRLLDYRTSGRAAGDYSRVVGYGAISIERNP